MIASSNVLSLCIAIGLAAPSNDEQRPWDAPGSLTQSRRDEATRGSPDERVAFAELCLREGRSDLAVEALGSILSESPDHTGARAALGMEVVEGAWQFEELRRFDSSRPAPSLDLEPMASNDQKKTLNELGRGFSEKGSSSYFELNTDLDKFGARRYARTLDRHFGTLRTRFRAYRGGPIRVLVFGKRSDYLHYYRQNLGAGGEHVLGFYTNDLLVFYDDPSNREDVTNTARHECTHLLIDRCYERAPLPLWFHEGFACYLAADADEARATYTAGLLLDVMHGLEAGIPISLDELLDHDGDDFGTEHYAHAWSWFHFLNQPEYEDPFQDYLKALRDRVAVDQTREACRAACRRLLLDCLEDPLPTLQQKWAAYFRQTFLVQGPGQHLDLADFALRKRWLATEGQESVETLEMANRSIDAAASSDDPEDASRAAGARLWLVLRRLQENVSNLDSARLSLRELVKQMRDVDQQHDPAELARIASIAVRTIQMRIGRQPDHAVADGRATLLDQAGDSDQMIAIAALQDDLITVAHQSLRHVLAEEPCHRGALHDWLFLCRAATPHDLETLFPRLRLLVESDPSDMNLAALALAYDALGQKDYARHLMQAAERRALVPAEVAWYASALR